jgi:hypothetical protein
MQATIVTFPLAGQLYIIEDLLPVALAGRIRTWFEQHDTDPGWSADSRFAHRPGRLVYQHTTELLTQALSVVTAPPVIAQLAEWTGCPLVCTSVEAWLDLPGYTIDPHLDVMQSAQEFWGLQVFFARTTAVTLGTAFYNNAQPVVNLPLRQNLAYFVTRGDTVVHGLAHAVPEGQVRYSIHFKYRTTT